MRTDFLVDREEVDRFLREREYSCVRLAETIQRARAFSHCGSCAAGFVNLWARGSVDGLVATESEETIHCALPKSEDEDNSLIELLRSHMEVKKVTGSTGDTLRVVRGLGVKGYSTQSYTLMRRRKALNAAEISPEFDDGDGHRIEIIDATKANLETLTLLHSAYEREELLMHSFHLETEIRMRALLDFQMISMALVDGQPVGKINTNARGIFCDQIGGFYVMPAHRGKGIGTALLRRLLSRIEEAEKDAVLYVRSENLSARRLYDRAGFLPAGEYAMSIVSPTN